MPLRLLPILLASLALFATGTANAEDALIGFRSPSKNIACQYYDYDRVVALRCDIMEANVTAPRPRDCDLEFGKAFEMKPKGAAERLCYGDTIMDPVLPLLDGLRASAHSAWTTHWNSPEHRDAVRPARYAVLLAVAHEQAVLGHDLVLVAPFTAELTGGAEWELLRSAVAPTEPRVVWLDAPAEVLASRVRDRGEPRDVTETGIRATKPAVPFLRIDATSTTSAQADLVLAAS